MGDVGEHQRAIGMLETTDANIVSMYAAKTGKSNDELLAAMEAETWMNADEAFEFGLVDAVIGKRDAPQTVPEGMYQKTPAALLKPAVAGSKTKWRPRQLATFLKSV